FFFFSSRRRHTRSKRDWRSDVCSSDLGATVDAIGSLLSASGVEVQTAELMTVGLVQMAVVVLRMSTPRGEQTLTGSAIVRTDAKIGRASCRERVWRAVGGVAATRRRDG